MLSHGQLEFAPVAAREAVGENEHRLAAAFNAVRDVPGNGATSQPVPAKRKGETKVSLVIARIEKRTSELASTSEAVCNLITVEPL